MSGEDWTVIVKGRLTDCSEEGVSTITPRNPEHDLVIIDPPLLFPARLDGKLVELAVRELIP